VIIARLTTTSMSLSILLDGQCSFFRNKGYCYHLASGPSSHVIDDEFYTELPIVRRPNVYKDLIALWATYLWLRKIKPDILHTHTPKAGLIGMIAGFLSRVPVRIHTVAGIPWMESTGFPRFLYKVLERITYSCATKVYPNSLGLRRFLLQEIPSASEKYKVLGNGSSNGIDVNFFSPRAVLESKEKLRSKFNLNQDSFIWIFIGRIVKDKGINELIEAFMQMDLNHTLLLVGPFEDDQDPVSEETKKLIETTLNIHAFDFQKDVRPFIKLSDALVFPSYREGFPNVPMQAAAMGLPQIATDINGCNEIVIPGVNGLLIPVKDVAALKTSMKLLSEDKDLRQTMTLKSRKTILDRYSRQEIWRLIGEEYNFLLKKS
jgi:glycosyltransferase involved in cell wall biosynthesis